MSSSARKRGGAVGVICAMLLVGTACTGTAADPGPSPSGGVAPTSPGSTSQPSAGPGAATVAVAPATGAKSVRPDQPVTVKALSGTLESVTVADADGDKVKGAFDDAKATWTSVPQLASGTTYTVTSKATGIDGKSVTSKSTFKTLAAARSLKASVAPLGGTVAGVGIPIQIFWNNPVKDKAAVERRLSVKTSVPVEGSWHWMSDKQVNYRPKNYWPAGTKIAVDIAIQGVNAGGQTWGAASRLIEFSVGKSVVTNVNVQKHIMVVRIDGKVARTIPVTAGKDGFTTRSGVKVIMEKYPVKRMDARTVGIQPGDPEYYDIRDVRWAQRVTSSGEFIHGAPWSSGSQGSENVSHGCVGMSLQNAQWFFQQTQIGAPVIVTGTSRQMTQGNGWADWNLTWDQYKAGSALS